MTFRGRSQWDSPYHSQMSFLHWTTTPMTDNPPTNDHDFEDPGDELELEPIDPEILQHERQRIKQKIRDVEDRVDIDELITPDEPTDPFTFDDLKRFRFSIRHLLIATAVCALLLTMSTQMGLCMSQFVGGCGALAVGWWLVIHKERQQARARQLLREQMKARIAAQRAAEDGKPLATTRPDTDSGDASQKSATAGFSFSFSMRQLLGTFTIVAIALGLVQGFGGADNAALLLGFIALLGLAAHAAGFDPPPVVVLGWWMLLVLYILIGLFAAIANSDSSAYQTRKSRQLWCAVNLTLNPGVDICFEHVQGNRSSDEHCIMKAAHIESVA